MLNLIGNFQFLALHGHPVPPKGQPQVLARPGVDGVGIWRTGERGVPFEMVSQVDMPDMATARRVFKLYVESIEQNPVPLIQDDYDYAAEGFNVVVLDVQERQRHALATSTGGLNLPSLAYLEAAWVLIAVPVPTY